MECEICGEETTKTVLTQETAHPACDRHIVMYDILAKEIKAAPHWLWLMVKSRELKKLRSSTTDSAAPSEGEG